MWRILCEHLRSCVGGGHNFIHTCHPVVYDCEAREHEWVTAHLWCSSQWLSSPLWINSNLCQGDFLSRLKNTGWHMVKLIHKSSRSSQSLRMTWHFLCGLTWEIILRGGGWEQMNRGCTCIYNFSNQFIQYNEQRKPSASYKWTGSVWEITSWSSRLVWKPSIVLEESIEYIYN